MTIPLDRLPPPDAVVAEEFAALRDQAIADLVSRVPDYEPRATDPAVRLLEVAAYLRLLLGGRINDAVRGTFLATAAGADLDHVVAILDVTRLAGESDEALRARARLAWDTVSTAGPTDAYRFHALSVPGVRDVSVASPNPGEVVVTVLALGAGGVPDQALLDAVEAVLDADTVRPVTDDLTVQAVTVVAYDVTAKLKVSGGGPDLAIVKEAATEAVRAYVDAYAVGRSIRRSALFAACHVPGVDQVELTAPVADVAATAAQVAIPGTVTVTAEVA
ncbi:MAG: baseplate J/gp47 family protein [Acidobacteria bacterium]|nr:baseplate J/gp47 family protein [Acidobacteriota bacterium]